jgi:predicted PurR-regulated permease PerM
VITSYGRYSSATPFLVALIGIFGGLQVFGLIGLFVGPVIMAALLTVWREWLGRADDAERGTPWNSLCESN